MNFNVNFAEMGVGLAHHFSSGVYAKETHIPAGLKISQHKHSFDHMSLLASGSVIVRADGWVESYTAPAVIDMKADTAHEVEAITDVVWFCIHATNVTDPEKIDMVLAHE